uniref:Uncharacterized protein n=1 Tax=viral metagenome TaxID=1070528 RepID=A0A6H1Z6L4_9ZZZZ
MAEPIDTGAGAQTALPELPRPTSYRPGESNDPMWEEILAAFNEEHQAKYGMPMNRPWGADSDAQASYAALLAQYDAKRAPSAIEPSSGYYVGGSGAGSGKGRPGYDDPNAPGGTGGGGGGGGGGGVGRNPYENKNDALLAGFKNPLAAETYALAKSQIEYAQRRLSEIEQARKLGDMTGSLTSDEKKMFTEMEDSAVANLKSQVNAQTQDVWNTALAELVNRGVLQGTVGQKILGTISSENVRTIAEGSNAIRGQTNANMLQVQEGNKNRALQWDSMLGQESLGLLGIGQGYANADLNAQLQKLGLGVGANLQFAGIASQESMSAQNRALQMAIAALNAQTQSSIATAGYANQWKIAGLNAGTQLQLGGLYANAADKSSMYGAWGNMAPFVVGLATKYGPSIYDWWNTNYGGGSTPNDWYIDPTDYSTPGGWT